MAMRTCIISGKTDESSNLLRFVVSPDGLLTLDLAEKLPGRGAYVEPRPESVREALKKTKFAKHIGFQKKLSDLEIDTFILSVAHLLEKRFVQQLSLARKYGCAIAGAGKLKDNASLVGLLIANDASVRESRQLESATNPNWVMREIPAETLGGAFGRHAIAYVGILGIKEGKSQFDGSAIKHSFHRWKPFIHVISCHEGTDGCINEQG
ncbi:DUF448 domain-containing protein [Alphaproteobacteria bacterium]|nr:DUF448 domain-containing protein [Alphaproteobacteria bacterium]MDA9816057.1 DUF448 domain-containing protein [Alphaproteobacteria bacterium]MDC0462379.1 DUF448 domain-containing protein [Alphaproteobacteria bacterium]